MATCYSKRFLTIVCAAVAWVPDPDILVPFMKCPHILDLIIQLLAAIISTVSLPQGQ